MIVLPPSFPYGGMENPRLTFLTPTMIAGDRSLVDLIAHELAHSWSGNLVTNASWKHMWLNEGFTTYVTTRIVEKLYGSEVAQMVQVDQEELAAWIRNCQRRNGAGHARCGHRSGANLHGRRHHLSERRLVPGHLEQRAGRAVFDPFLRGWFDQHAFQSVHHGQFVAYLKQEPAGAHPDVMPAAELDEWLYGTGIPASAKRVARRAWRAGPQRTAWLKGELPTAELNGQLDRAGVDALPERHRRQGHCAQMQELDQAFGLGKSGNNEIAYRFYLSSVKAGYVRRAAQKFLMSVGRQKFVVPLYSAC
jgi:hypothetical protein